MSEVNWIKLTTDMFENRKIRHLRRLPDGNSIVLIWVMLLTMAGRCNAGGMIFLTENIPYTTKMLADELDFEENTVKLALQAMEQLSMISLDPLLVVNWEEYQNSEALDRLREQARLRKQREREQKKLTSRDNERDKNVTVTQCHATEEEIDKELEKEGIEPSNEGSSCRTEYRQAIIDAWNAAGISTITKIVPGSARAKQLNARIREYGLNKVLQAIENVKISPFLHGQNRQGWIITFDWFVRPNNFPKVLDGNYTERKEGSAGGRAAQLEGADAKWGISGADLG